MNSQMSNRLVTIRATWTSYLVLAAIWILLAIVYLFLSIRNPGRNFEYGLLIAGVVAILWCTWLRGFKITLSDRFLEYRDGIFRSSKISLNEIKDIKSENVRWNLFGKKFGIPRITVLTAKEEMAICINPKPFGRLDLQRVMKELGKTKN